MTFKLKRKEWDREERATDWQTDRQAGRQEDRGNSKKWTIRGTEGETKNKRFVEKWGVAKGGMIVIFGTRKVEKWESEEKEN